MGIEFRMAFRRRKFLKLAFRVSYQHLPAMEQKFTRQFDTGRTQEKF
jgi:hypothetical protein